MKLYDFFKVLTETHFIEIDINGKEVYWVNSEQKLYENDKEIKDTFIKNIKFYPGVDFDDSEGIICDIETV